MADYGYTTQKLEEKEVLVDASGGTYKLSIKILQDGGKGIYACVAQPAQDGGNPKAQSVILLNRKDSNALLKGHESWKEFASCPAVGASHDDSTANSY